MANAAGKAERAAPAARDAQTSDIEARSSDFDDEDGLYAGLTPPCNIRCIIGLPDARARHGR
jgi:hypothetical protein